MLAVSCQVCFHTAPFMDPTGKLDPSVFQAIRSQVEMLYWSSTFADVYTDLVSAATWPWATCSLLETQIPLFSLFSKLTQCLGCIHEEAFPLILPKYPLPLYPTTVNSIDSILPFFFFLEWHLVCFQTFLVYSRNEAPGVIDPAIQSTDIFL